MNKKHYYHDCEKKLRNKPYSRVHVPYKWHIRFCWALSGGGGGGGGESLKLNESKTAITQFMSRKSRSCGPHLKRSSFETSNQPSTAVSLFFGPSRRIVTIRQHISPYFNHHCVVFSKSVTNYNPKKYSGSHLSQLVS